MTLAPWASTRKFVALQMLSAKRRQPVPPPSQRPALLARLRSDGTRATVTRSAIDLGQTTQLVRISAGDYDLHREAPAT
jgi:hypothetical protein